MPMAKPIRATPTLRGEEAKTFIEAMIQREKSSISETDRWLNENIKKNRSFFESVLQ